MMFTSPTSSCFQLRWTQWVVDNVDPLIQVHFHAGSLVLEGLMEARKVAYCHKKMLLLHILMYLAPLRNWFSGQKLRELHLWPKLFVFLTGNNPKKPHGTSTSNWRAWRRCSSTMVLSCAPSVWRAMLVLSPRTGFLFWLVRRARPIFFKDMPGSYW